jgi:RNA polymerase sigma-70 factor (ECF subfamily)
VRRGADLYGYSVRTADVNGRPGRVLYDRDGAVISVLSLDVDEDGIHAVHVVVNPDKLRHIASASGESAQLAGSASRLPASGR